MIQVHQAFAQTQDKWFSDIDNSASFQSIAIENYKNSDSILFYIAFDKGEKGLVKTCYWAGDSGLKEINSFLLPKEFYHPNDIQVIGDTLLVTGWGYKSRSHIGWFDKKSGELLKMVTDNIEEKNMRLQFSFQYNDVLFRGLYDGERVDLQYHNNKGIFTTIFKDLKPQYLNYHNQPIQGSKIIGENLAILTSFPTRIDLYNLEDYEYLCSYFGEYEPDSDSTEPEGLGVVSYKGDTLVFFGLRYPNRINYLNYTDLKKNCFNYKYKVGGGLNEILIMPFSNIVKNDGVQIRYKALFDNYLTIRIVDTSGKNRHVLHQADILAGDHEIFIDANQNLSGIYLLLFETRDNSYSRKILYVN